jgi:hypothetical protein
MQWVVGKSIHKTKQDARLADIAYLISQKMVKKLTNKNQKRENTISY